MGNQWVNGAPDGNKFTGRCKVMFNNGDIYVGKFDYGDDDHWGEPTFEFIEDECDEGLALDDCIAWLSLEPPTKKDYVCWGPSAVFAPPRRSPRLTVTMSLEAPKAPFDGQPDPSSPAGRIAANPEKFTKMMVELFTKSVSQKTLDSMSELQIEFGLIVENLTVAP